MSLRNDGVTIEWTNGFRPRIAASSPPEAVEELRRLCDDYFAERADRDSLFQFLHDRLRVPRPDAEPTNADLWRTP